ncbi:MAG: SIMPL domain-containing protein, partial [Anaerolineales bacterium]|nr:SIMPL domain-containing protein [Anaerolineales bacterium]
QTTLLKSIRIVPIFLVLVLLVAGCASSNGTGLPEERLTLSVTGYGQASGTPDLANAQLGVSIVDPDIGKAINEANATIERITNAVVAQGVSSNDVLTSNYSVWSEDVYDPQNGMPTGETRYRVDISLAITVREVHRMGDLIAVGLDAGATNVSGINFTIDDTAALEAEARSSAITDVRDRAEKLAQGLGMTLGDPISVGEGSAGAPGPVYSYGLKGDIGGIGGGGVGAGVPSIISPGQTTIGVQVTVIYELLP